MPILAPEQLEGVSERLAIADQNILDLNGKITDFLKPFPGVEIKIKDGNPLLTEIERNAWQNLQKTAKEIKVPLSFSIRAGEVIHHLRSSLDHIAWQLADPIKREDKPTHVQFPIVTDWSDNNEASRYQRQTQFIVDPNALSIINKVQPAWLKSRGESLNTDPLYIVHWMDIFDKHRALAMFVWVPRMQGVSNVTREYLPIQDADGTRMLIPLIGTAKVQANMKVSLHVAFAKTNKWEERPVIELLFNLTDAIRNVVGLFAE